MTEIVYVFTNPAMPGYVKIGKTSKANVEERLKELSNPTGIPVPFECLYAAEVADATKVETAIHMAFDCDRPNKKREFFTTDPERIITLLEAFAISDATPSTRKLLDEITSPEDKKAQSIAFAKTKKQEWRHDLDMLWSKIKIKVEEKPDTEKWKMWKAATLDCIARKNTKEFFQKVTTEFPGDSKKQKKTWKSLADTALKLEEWDKMPWKEYLDILPMYHGFKTKLKSIIPSTKEEIDKLRDIINKRWGVNGRYPLVGKYKGCQKQLDKLEKQLLEKQ